MYAEIIVNQPSRAVDRVFDYEIPQELDSSVLPGSRVIVPFSNGNVEKEGFVMRVKSDTQASGIKRIISVSGAEPAFRECMIPVIEFLHEKYLATYLDIIHMIIPAGTAVRSLEWAVLEKAEQVRNETDRRMLQLLEDNGGSMEVCALQTYFDKTIKARLSGLEKSGIIKREYRHSSAVHRRKIRAVRLIADEEQTEAFRKKTRSAVQARMLSILSSGSVISAADLVRFSGGSYSALSSLYAKGFTEYYDIEVERQAYEYDGQLEREPLLTAEQQAAVSRICSGGAGEVFLLHGVTGSGKTEVYMRSIMSCIERGRTALMLVPEISLTPQLLSRFVKRFGRRIAILHSALSLGERYDQWLRIMRGEADIVIGARSALFAPLDNIGIIIVDEEHSETYKSEMSPRYQTRDTALFMAKLHGAAVVLASATPSIESYTRALEGRYTLIEMKKRYNENDMPEIDIVDMRSELENGNKSMFSKTLYNAVKENIERGSQTILFMNRRGYSTFVSCRKCGFVPDCPNCNITLTYHSYDDSLKCHYCGHHQPNYSTCPMCGSKYIRYFGGGTQRVEDEVRRLFPGASTLRLDADVTGRKNAHKEILDRFARERTDILIGTQMVAKGLDFEGVTLVGVISADTMLHINDFRSGERTFDTLEQVSGRAGRGRWRGRAVIQTYEPENYAVSLVKTHDYGAFYRKAAAERRLMWYPPFSEMICILFSGTKREDVRSGAFAYKDAFGDINEIEQKIALLGPIPSGISKIKNKYRWQIIIKCDNADALNSRLLSAEAKVKKAGKYGDISVVIDKDPVTIY